MKRVLCACLVFGLMSGSVSAYVEFLGADGVNTTYTATTGLLDLSEAGIVITAGNDDDSQDAIVGGSFAMTSNFISGFHFEGGAFEFADGTATTIISGNILEINFTEFDGLLLGSGVAEMLVENLPEDYVIPGPAETVTVTFNITPAFSDFSSDFSGQSKVNFLLPEPVPEPVTLTLLALGGLMLRKRK